MQVVVELWALRLRLKVLPCRRSQEFPKMGGTLFGDPYNKDPTI